MKNLNLIFLVVLYGLCLGTTQLSAQAKFGSAPGDLNKDAVLELASTNKGILFPRLTLTSLTAADPLGAHVAGMVVYNTGTNVAPGLYVNNGSGWIPVGGSLYALDGSIPASSTRNVTFGADAKLNFNDSNLFIDSSTDRVGIGTSTPRATLEVVGTGAIIVPVGTTAQRPTPAVPGMIRFNSSSGKFEGYTGATNSWVEF